MILSSPAKFGLFALGIFCFVGLYLVAAEKQSTYVNTNSAAHDQTAVMNLARRISNSPFGYVAPRNRMPLYAAFQALFHTKSENDEEYFKVAKFANVLLSLTLLAVIFAIFRAYFSLHHTINVVLVAGLGVFALKAPYVQPELLYYVLTLGCFILMLRLLKRPALAPSILLGCLLAVTHLTKASTLPAILIFVVSYAVNTLFLRRSTEVEGSARTAGQLKAALCGIIVVVTFLAVLSPYLRTSKRIYGRYFYNVNSTFYMWCDSWEEAKRFSQMYDDRHVYPNIPAEQMPSLSNYLRTHSMGRVVGRLFKGLGRMFTETFRSFWYMAFLLIYTAAASFGIYKARSRFLEAIRREPIIPIFILAYFGVYIALYAWWMILARSQRFVLALFLPFLFTVSYILRRFGGETSLTVYGRRYSLERLTEWTVSVLSIGNAVLLLSWTAKSVNGGSTM